MSPRVSSRLAKHEQERLLKQTILMITAAIILGLGFIFFVLPFSIRVITTLTNSDQVPMAGNTLPPQVPILSAPPTATASASIKINGFAQAETEVVLVVNGEQQNRQTTTAEGTFEFDTQLLEGENVVSAFAINAEKKESELSQSYTVSKDTQAPTLEISSPTEGQSIELRRNQNLTITGKTDPGVQLTLNGRLMYAQADGAFSSTYLLQEGENKLEFIAIDQAGNQTLETITVSFRL